LLDFALAYASLKWRVFPLQPRSKLPFPGSRAVHDATTDPAVIRAWWSITPDANIAIATGISLDAVDLDIARGGIESYTQLAGQYQHAGPIVATGTGGRHLYFAPTPGLRNTRDILGMGIETSTQGRYIVAPPSIHPNGKPYTWEVSPDAPLPALPPWLMPPAGNMAACDPSTAERPHAAAITRAMAYLAEVEPAISGQGGHNATFRAACECFRFGLTESEAWEALNWFNANKCQPAWSEKELRHKIRQARKQVDGDGTFGSKLEEGNSYEREDRTSRIDQVSGRTGAGDSTGAPSPISPGTDSGMPSGNGGSVAAGNTTPRVPPELLSPPGLVGEIVAWINSTAYKPQPILAIGNTLAFFGAVVGRKVRTPSDLRTNLYCLGVGESGCGKDHSRKCVKRICEAANIFDAIISGEDVSSDGAIGNAVNKRNSTLFQLDEIGHFLGNANSKFASTHLKAVVPEFMKLFSSANTKYVGKEYASRDRNDITEPNVCLYGTTVPSRLYDGVGPAEIADGLLARMLVFVSDNPDPDTQEIGIPEVPESIRQMIEAWFSRKLDDTGRNMIGPAPLTIAFNAEAQEIIDTFSADCKREQTAARVGDNIDVLWSRAAEHAKKVSIILACGVEFQSPIVTADIAIYSCHLVSWCIRSFIAQIKDSMSSTEFGKTQAKLLRVIRLHPDGIKLKALGIATKGDGISSRIRREALEELALIGSIRIEMVATATKTAMLYVPA
jgi:hypothetical protein